MARSKSKPHLTRDSELGYELASSAKEIIASTHRFLGGNPANIQVHDPQPNQRISKAGSWIMITRQLPPIEGRIDQHFKVGRIFFAEHDPNTDEHGFQPNGTYKIVCRSEWGDLWLWPYEYASIPVENVIALWTLEEIVFHPRRIDSARFSEVAFYARSRGIGLADAAVMALGTLQGNVGWFEPRPDLAEQCEAMERSVHKPFRGLER